MSKNRIYLGVRHGAGQYIYRHEWTLGWYWSLGHLGNNQEHWHLEHLLRGPEHAIAITPQHVNAGYERAAFESSWLTQDQWFIVRDLFMQAYALKHAAEAYRYGGHQTDRAAAYRVPHDAALVARINADLGALLDRIWVLLESWEAIWNSTTTTD